MSRMSLSDAKPISVQDVTAFWTQMGEASSHQNIGFFRTTYLGSGPIYVISLHHSVRMIPFVRSQEELFEATAKRASKLHKLRIVINGPTYGLTTAGKVDALAGSDPVHPSETLQEGRIVYKGKIIGGSRSDMYFVRNDSGEPQKFKFGRGSAPTKTDAAIGNFGPLIINGVPFGPINRYNPPVPGASSEGEYCRNWFCLLGARRRESVTCHCYSGPSRLVGVRLCREQLMALDGGLQYT